MCKMCKPCKRCHLLLLRHGLVYHFTSVPRARTRRDPMTVEQSQWSKGPQPKRGPIVASKGRRLIGCAKIE